MLFLIIRKFPILSSFFAQTVTTQDLARLASVSSPIITKLRIANYIPLITRERERERVAKGG